MKIEIDLKDIFGEDFPENIRDFGKDFPENIRDEVIDAAARKISHEYIYGRFNKEVRSLIDQLLNKHMNEVKKRIFPELIKSISNEEENS